MCPESIDILFLSMKSYYLTTAIDYANGSPHLGHAYEKILADVIGRSTRLLGKSVKFVTGLDEHGQKVQQGARAEGMEPQERCDLIAEGVLAAIEEVGVEIPVVVRLEGNNADLGAEILSKAKIKIESINNLGDAAKKAVELAK